MCMRIYVCMRMHTRRTSPMPLALARLLRRACDARDAVHLCAQPLEELAQHLMRVLLRTAHVPVVARRDSLQDGRGPHGFVSRSAAVKLAEDAAHRLGQILRESLV